MKPLPLFLVIEDSEDFRSLLEFSYQKEALSCQLLFTATAEDALTHLEQAVFLPQLLLLDYDLPGMDGLALLTMVRERYKYLPVLMISFSDDPNIIQSAYEKGVNSFITKPLGYKDLKDLWYSIFTFGANGLATVLLVRFINFPLCTNQKVKTSSRPFMACQFFTHRLLTQMMTIRRSH